MLISRFLSWRSLESQVSSLDAAAYNTHKVLRQSEFLLASPSASVLVGTASPMPNPLSIIYGTKALDRGCDGHGVR